MSVWDTNRSWARAEAEDILAQYWDGSLPVNPAQIARGLDIDVYKAQLPRRISGMIRKPQHRPEARAEIVVDTDEVDARKRFTIAHELGHFRRHVLANGETPIDHVDYRNGTSSPEEFAANEFAGTLLMPEDAFRARANLGMSDRDLARIFGVSAAAVRVRREVLGA